MIVAAAIRDRETGSVYTNPKPARHAAIASEMARFHGLESWNEERYERGFIDENHNFYSRKQAIDHVFQCGQELLTDSVNVNLGLYTEDIW